MIENWEAVGIDQSLMHGACVVLSKAGDLVDMWFLAQLAQHKRPDVGFRIPASVMKCSKDPSFVHTVRLLWLRAYYREMSVRIRTRGHDRYLIGIEDYAYHMTQGSHQLGEGGGLLKTVLWDCPKFNLRLFDPVSVKMFATDNGNASKTDVIDAVKSVWGMDFSEYGANGDYPPEEDICDAYVIARMVWTEQKVRDGEIMLKDLPPGQRRIFTRMTDKQPVPLLERDWISKG